MSQWYIHLIENKVTIGLNSQNPVEVSKDLIEGSLRCESVRIKTINGTCTHVKLPLTPDIIKITAFSHIIDSHMFIIINCRDNDKFFNVCHFHTVKNFQKM
jgi:hypothetical protein